AGRETANLAFFDITSFELRTSSKADKVTLEAGGLTAYGLLNFAINTGAGSDELTVKSEALTPPKVGQFSTGLPSTPYTGEFLYDGGTGTETDKLIVNRDADWTLSATKL